MISNLIGLLLNFVGMFLKISPPSSFPEPLDSGREKKLFLKMKQGSEEARSELIEHNLRLVAHIVKKYYVNSKNQEDIMSVGTIGLIKAVDSFDISNGARFATYAAKYIQNAILS